MNANDARRIYREPLKNIKESSIRVKIDNQIRDACLLGYKFCTYDAWHLDAEMLRAIIQSLEDDGFVVNHNEESRSPYIEITW